MARRYRRRRSRRVQGGYDIQKAIVDIVVAVITLTVGGQLILYAQDQLSSNTSNPFYSVVALLAGGILGVLGLIAIFKPIIAAVKTLRSL